MVQRDYDELHDLHHKMLKLESKDKDMIKGIIQFAAEEASFRIK